MSSYILGAVLVALVIGSSAYTAGRLRARLLPGWNGPPARLVEIVAALGLVLVAAELLGLIGLLRPWSLVPLLLIAALAAKIAVKPLASSLPVDPELHSVPPSSTARSGIWPTALALTVTFLLVAQWGAFVAQNLDHGITNFDSVWYHLPYAAEIARTGSVTYFPHTETVFNNWFYPQNAELFHGISISLTGHDFLSIFLNMGWLGLALLAGWCVGRPYGRQHLTLIAVAVVLSAHTLVVREPGTAKNDVAAVALVLAGVAIMLNRSSSIKDGFGRVSAGWAVAAGGLAFGLAAGTKVTAIATAGMMTLAVLYSAVDGKRWRTLGVWTGAALIGGGWWYLRNLVVAGNPIPQIEKLGPFGLPGPERIQYGRPDFAVIHYLTDTVVWREYFVPGLSQAFGRLWPVLLVVAVSGVIALVFRGPGRLTRAHGLVALVALAAYLVTPLGAAGPDGHPTAFAINLRFITPALTLALVLVALLPWFDRGRRGYGALAGLFSVLFVFSWIKHPLYSTSGAGFGVLFAIVFLALPALAWRYRESMQRTTGHSRLGPTGLAVIACGALFALIGWPLSSYSLKHRYTDFEPETGMAPVYRWADGVSDQRIGLAGSTAGFKSFGFYGPDLSNRVIYLGSAGPAGGFYAIGSCRPFVSAVNAAHLDYLVTSPFLNFFDPDQPLRSPELGWVRGDPALSPVVVGGPVRVWRVNGALDPARCDRPGVGHDEVPGRRGI